MEKTFLKIHPFLLVQGLFMRSISFQKKIILQYSSLCLKNTNSPFVFVSFFLIEKRSGHAVRNSVLSKKSQRDVQNLYPIIRTRKSLLHATAGLLSTSQDARTSAPRKKTIVHAAAGSIKLFTLARSNFISSRQITDYIPSDSIQEYSQFSLHD